MNKQQKQFIQALTDNNGSIKKALDSTGYNMKQVLKWSEEDNFKSELEAAKALAMASTIAMLQQQAESGSVQATVKLADLLKKQADNKDETGLEDRVMELIFDYANSNNDATEKFKTVFNCTQYAANSVFSRIAAIGKTQPSKRAELSEERQYNLMVSKFERGELSEVDLMQDLMKNALRESETSSRADVRNRAAQLVLQLHERLESINERKRREAEEDNFKWCDKTDAALAGVHPSQIVELKAQIMGKQID